MTGSPASHIVGAVPVHAMHRRQAARQARKRTEKVRCDTQGGGRGFVFVCKVVVRYGGYVVAVIYIRTDR